MKELQTIRFWVLMWITKNRERLPVYILGTFAFAAALILSGLGLASLSPYAGEIWTNLLIRLGIVMNITLMILTCITVVSLAVWNFGKGIRVEGVQSGKLLSAGNWQEPDISPDVLVVMRANETTEQFAERVEASRMEAEPTKWVFVIPFRYPVAMIYQTPTRAIEFVRDVPPFQGEDWTEEQKVCPVGTYFGGETIQDYRRYVDISAFYFREWAARVKQTKIDGPQKLEVFLNGIRHSLNVLLLSLFALPLFAQNAAAVSDALGTRIREVPEQGAKVAYIFETKELYRTGNGRSDYIELLKNVPGYNDRRGGAFIAVTKNGNLVARASQTQAVADTRTASKDDLEQMIRPNRENAGEGRTWTIPDSLTMAENINRAKDGFSFYRSQFWESLRPIWGLVMFIFWGLIPLLGLSAVVLWFWAMLAASEEMPSIHWHSSRGLTLIVGSVWTILIVNSALSLIYWEWSGFPLLIGFGLIAVFAWKTASWIIPNIHAKPGGRTAFTGMSNNNPRLPG